MMRRKKVTKLNLLANAFILYEMNFIYKFVMIFSMKYLNLVEPLDPTQWRLYLLSLSPTTQYRLTTPKSVKAERLADSLESQYLLSTLSCDPDHLWKVDSEVQIRRKSEL